MSDPLVAPVPVPIIYLAGPIAAPNAWCREMNVRRAEEYALKIWEFGACPLNTHTMGRHYYGAINEETIMQSCLELIRRSDAIYLLPGWGESRGAKREAALAENLGKMVLRTLPRTQAWVEEFQGRDR